MKPLRQSPALDEMLVYVLVDPVRHEPFYVGRTIDVKARLAKHCRDARAESKVPVKRHIKALLRRRLRPCIVVLEKTNFLEVEKVERRWVRHFAAQFNSMKNILLMGEVVNEKA